MSKIIMKYAYPALLKPEILNEQLYYNVTFPDVDDAYTFGDSYINALEMAEDALNLCLMNYEDQDIIPNEPSTINSIDAKGGLVALIKADTDLYRRMLNKKTVRRNVVIPEWLNVKANEMHINVSRVLRDALIEEIGRA